MMQTIPYEKKLQQMIKELGSRLTEAQIKEVKESKEMPGDLICDVMLGHNMTFEEAKQAILDFG